MYNKRARDDISVVVVFVVVASNLLFLFSYLNTLRFVHFLTFALQPIARSSRFRLMFCDIATELVQQ